MKRILIPLAFGVFALWEPRAASADQVVQIQVDSLLNGRPVSTFTGGAVVRWTTGVDQNDGFATTAAVAALKQSGPALPDDGVFAADATHPEMALHFSNAAAADSEQAHIVPAAGDFELDVPRANYSKLFLAITSSSGDSALSVTLNYADGSPTLVTFTLPDWGTGKPLPTNPPIFFDLIAGLHKWDAQDNSVDTPSHALTGVELSPVATQTLTSVQVSKPNAAQYLVFWGAAGITTGSAAGGAGSGGESGIAGGAAGASGSSGSAGSEATGGASSNAGSGGAVTAAGGASAAGPSSLAGGANSAGAAGSVANAAGATAAAETPSDSGCTLGSHSDRSGRSFLGGLLCALGTLCIGARHRARLRRT
jgi:hypothetical protein